MAAQKLTALRKWMKAEKIDAVIVPHADRFQGEYLAPEDERLAWLTGFTGSAGMAIITRDQAILFTNSIYMLQAAKQIDLTHFNIIETPPTSAFQWVQDNTKSKQVIAVDPWLLTVAQLRLWERATLNANCTLRLLETNPIDRLWEDRPAPLLQKAELHDVQYSGVSRADKIEQVVAKLSDDAERLLICDPTLVCWLLNIRGRDIPHVPVLQAFACVTRDGQVTLFTTPDKVSAALRKSLGKNITIAAMDNTLSLLARSKTTLQFDPNECPAAIKQTLQEKKIKTIEADNPCYLLRACKNATEIKGAERAHQKDAVAFKKFFKWFAKQDFARQTITEMDIVAKLHAFRAEDPDFIDDSFRTIAGFGPNGAIVHYTVTSETNLRLKPGNLLLLDSGAQYRYGTTDITRVLAVGKPTKDMQIAYRAVHQGLQDLCSTRFPSGTKGVHLDAIARRPLWQLGLNYGHGTGHGVGSYLSVHEGPQRFDPHNQTVLKPGMILSVEPGVYYAGRFGIRLENLVVVEADKRPGDIQEMLRLRILTDVAFDKILLG